MRESVCHHSFRESLCLFVLSTAFGIRLAHPFGALPSTRFRASCGQEKTNGQPEHTSLAEVERFCTFEA